MNWAYVVAQWYAWQCRSCRRRGFNPIPGSGRSPGEGNGSPLQYSCPTCPMERGAWWATVHGVAKESDMTTTQQKTPWIIYVMCLAQCQTRLAFNEMVVLKKKKCVFAPGGEIHTSAEGSWLASKEYFSLSRFVLLGTVPFWNFPFQTPSLTI